MSITGARLDALTTHSFSVQIGKIEHAAFTEFSGLEAEIEVFSYPEGGRNDHVHRLPGRTKESSNVVLTKGVAYTDDLWLWFQKATFGLVARENVSVVLYNAAHQEVKRWNINKAYPVKWVGPAFKAGENAVAIEKLELAHEGVKLAK